ncbi:ATP-grasp domain-containing protein [Ruminiclostridium josui]|uniref:preATP grasp domain-containing protein n=1 Tax=Ruminiclostridium josui TaxID=1499 RepID=UPI00046560F8
MRNDFNLVNLLTTERSKGIIVWLCNIGAEKYWSNLSAGVVNRQEDIAVNRMEEMNLLICREQDIVILREMPNEDYLENLKRMGFSIPTILSPENADLLTPISELVLGDENLLNKLKEAADKNDDLYFVPYGITHLEEEIAQKTGMKIMGAPSHINAKINDKIFNREISEKLGLTVCQGKVCSSTDEIREEYERLTNNEPFFSKVIIKEPKGASGKGLYIVDSKHKLESSLRMIARFSKGRTDSKWLVEGWYDKKGDVNYQIYVSPEGQVTVFSIKEQLLRDTVYIGSKMPPELEQKVLDSYVEYGQKIGRYLYEIGFTGVAGVDSIITEQDVCIPIIEINGRFTLSTYISFVNQILKDKKILSRYFRLTPEKPVNYTDICGKLDKEGLLINSDTKEGIFVYTSGTLPYKLHDSNDCCVGRAFALIVSDSWEKVSILNSKLENIMETYSK